MTWEGRAAQFKLPGAHNLIDALAACAIADRLGISADDVAQGLSGVAPLFGRGEVFRGDLTVIRDCYNANPESTEGAIAFCDDLSWPGRKVYVLGSMLELGESSRAEHERIGRAAATSKADALFFFGEDARASFEAAKALGGKPCFHFDDFDGLSAAVNGWVRPGDLALIKASRGMALERLADALSGGGR